MPHCVIECSAELSSFISFDVLVKEIHNTTENSGLFEAGDIKTRLVLSDNYLVGGKKEHFVHIIAHILSGRTVQQRKDLSDALVLTLCRLLPNVEMLSVEVREIEKDVYSNRRAVGSF
jgi:5-carboxymethyl-2-hydroxymuconate isomerase